MSNRACALFACVLSLLFLAAFSHAAASKSLDLEHGAYLSAADLDGALNGVAVTSRLEQKHSRLLWLQQGAVQRAVDLRGFAVNRIQRLPSRGATERIFLAGAVGGDPEQHGSYISRIYSWGERGLRLEWDSEQLEASLQGEDVLIVVGPGGRLWAALKAVGDERVEIAVGETHGYGTQGYEILARISLESEDASALSPFDTHFPSLAVLDEEVGSWKLALLWRGQAQILGAGRPALKALLEPSSQGVPGDLVWQPQGRTLWLHRGSRVSAYEVPSEAARADDKATAPALLQELGHVDLGALGGASAGLKTGADGSVLLLTHGKDRAAVHRLAVSKDGGLNTDLVLRQPWNAAGGLLGGQALIRRDLDLRVPDGKQHRATLVALP